MGKTVLYISYDGMLEPLGQSQVLAYLSLLAANKSIHLISFEKSTDWTNLTERKHLAQQIVSAGIVWHPLRYHKRLSALATAWDVLCGISLGLWLILRYRISVVHARSYVPSVMALALKRLTCVKYIFDMRGFWADERVDGGLWPRNGIMFRIAKSFEMRFLLAADHVVSLTHSAVREMRGFDYLQRGMPSVTVIPTCADLMRFKPLGPKSDSGGLVFGYVGTVGTWYLFDEVAKCFSLILSLRPDARFLIVNRNEHIYIRQRLANAGVPNSAVEILAANHAEVPKQMSRMDAGIFFIKPVFSKQASAPTKLAEFLGCGIPCLSNAGVGDMADVLEVDNVGVAIKAFDDESMLRALRQLIKLVDDPKTSARCVASATKHFSLDKGVRLYEKIYQTLS
jgi:glycosyltransferase involved in cell wall biosynthesis